MKNKPPNLVLVNKLRNRPIIVNALLLEHVHFFRIDDMPFVDLVAGSLSITRVIKTLCECKINHPTSWYSRFKFIISSEWLAFSFLISSAACENTVREIIHSTNGTTNLWNILQLLLQIIDRCILVCNLGLHIVQFSILGGN